MSPLTRAVSAASAIENLSLESCAELAASFRSLAWSSLELSDSIASSDGLLLSLVFHLHGGKIYSSRGAEGDEDEIVAMGSD